MQTCHLGFEEKDLFTILILVTIKNLKNQRAMDETLKNIRVRERVPKVRVKVY